MFIHISLLMFASLSPHRCAIQTMGDLSVRFGFYGGGWDGDIVGAQDEAGEALTISDPFETW